MPVAKYPKGVAREKIGELDEKGWNTAQICERLGLSKSTVQWHRKIYRSSKGASNSDGNKVKTAGPRPGNHWDDKAQQFGELVAKVRAELQSISEGTEVSVQSLASKMARDVAAGC